MRRKASASYAPGKRDVEGGGEKSVKGSSEAGTKLCLAALSRVVKPQDAAPCEDDGSAQHVGGHGLVGHHGVARTSGARENSPGLKADGLACVAVGGPAQSRWEGYAPTDYSRRGALPETARRNDHSVAPGATDCHLLRVGIAR